MQHFFPDLVFGWCFYLGLLGFLAAASYFDYRYLLIPKIITLSCLATGALMNAVRGGWLGSVELTVWHVSKPSAALGLLDGMLFSLEGFGTGFGIFMLMFVLGICRGGDVKLFAALGAWVGPLYILWLLLGASVILIVLSFGWLVFSSLFFGISHSRQVYSIQQAKKGMKGTAKPKHRLMSYSFPAALATLLIMGWIWGVDLNIRPRTGLSLEQSAERTRS
jgi:Flp pilus assembly protein protease CpaA